MTGNHHYVRMAVLLMLLAACGGTGDPSDTTSSPGATSPGPGSTSPGPGATQPTGGGGEQWVDVDGTRYEARQVTCGSDPSDGFHLTAQHDGPSGQLVLSEYNALNFDDLAIDVGFSEDSLTRVRSQGDFRWLDFVSGLPLVGFSLTVDSDGVRGGPITLDAAGGESHVVSFDLRFSRSECARGDTAWTTLSGPTPPGDPRARFEINGEVFEFDGTAFADCRTDGGDLAMSSNYMSAFPGFSIRVREDGDFGGPSYAGGGSVELHVDQSQRWVTQEPSSGSSLIESLEVQGRSASGTAAFVLMVGPDPEGQRVPGTFDVHCGG